ncbi:hypothetical protein GCM10022254_42330 [Actinomadura meridiana]|uniref:ATP-grasp domain-containing protein n=1 Tax=Actinomadura meridiana TaxID=559626 RepID=A0ABP8C813_9ACTN
MTRDVIRRRAFVLMGDPPKVGGFLADLHSRDLAILMITGPPRSDLDEASRAFLDVPDHPFSVIDETALLEGDDLAGIVDRIRRWSDRYSIAGIFGASAVFAEAAAIVADGLGIPGVGMRAARVCRDKLLQRHYLGAWSPESRLATAESGDEAVEWAAKSLPVVVKPLHLSSSVGVRQFDDATALARHLGRLGPGDRLLIEPRVNGREYNVDIITVRGRPVFSAITQKGTNEQSTPFFAELVHTIPPVNLNERENERLLETARDVVRHLRFETGWAHAEYRLNEAGEPVLMEIAARPPGDGCMALFHLATGHPFESLLIEAALGKEVAYPEPRRRVRQVYFDHAPGILRDVTVEWPPDVSTRWLCPAGIWPPPRPLPRHAPPTLHEVMVQKNQHATLRPIADSGHRAVTALFDAPFDADIDLLDAQVRDAVTLHIETHPPRRSVPGGRPPTRDRSGSGTAM